MKKNSIILKRRGVIIESCQIWKIVSIFLSQDDSYVWKIHNKGTSINYVPAVLKTLSEVLSSIIEYLAREFSIAFQQNDFYDVLLWAPPNATHFPSLSKVPVALDSVILVHLQARFSKLISRTHFPVSWTSFHFEEHYWLPSSSIQASEVIQKATVCY